jgi:hypothetical protein
VYAKYSHFINSIPSQREIQMFMQAARSGVAQLVGEAMRIADPLGKTISGYIVSDHQAQHHRKKIGGGGGGYGFRKPPG